MKIYYDQNGITIYHGDCAAILPQLKAAGVKVEIAVTSPPYNLNKKASGGGSSKRSYEGWYADEVPERTYQAQQAIVIDALCDFCESSVFYNHRVRYAWHGRNSFRVPANVYHPMQWLNQFPIWCEVIWYRQGTTGHANGRFRLADERIYQIKKPRKWYDHGLGTVWTMLPVRDSEHVCPFPIELPERCILSATDPGDCVIDPYMGSGTTGMACIKHGRSFIGIEADEKSCEMAANSFRGSPSGTQEVLFA